MSKPRAAYTPMEDAAVMKEVVEHIQGGGGSGDGRALVSKHDWAAIAERPTLKDFALAGDALRRRVGELVKKLKRDEENEAAGKGRMRWGMAWPKSDEEQERDRLVGEYTKLQESAKQKPPQQPRPKQPPKRLEVSDENGDYISRGSAPLYPVASSTTSTAHIKPTVPPLVKRKDPPPPLVSIAIESDDDTFDAEYSYDFDCDPQPPHQHPRQDNALENEHLELKRRRLEMDERMQSRMMDIQAEQINLQREQLRFQTESLRAVADATQAIARALHAFPKCS